MKICIGQLRRIINSPKIRAEGAESELHGLLMLLLAHASRKNKKLHIQEICSTDVPEHLEQNKIPWPTAPQTR